MKLYKKILIIYAVGGFTPYRSKNYEKVNFFSDFFNFSLMVSIAYLYFLLLLVTIIKCEKKVFKKKLKKMDFSFSTLYFIFRKWTKINVQKSFKKKSFKKRGSFTFFH